MNEEKGNISRRNFLIKGATGVAALGASHILLNPVIAGMQDKSTYYLLEEEYLVPQDVLKKAMEYLMSKGADFGDVYVEYANVESFGSDDKKIKTSTLIEKGVGIRAVKDGKAFYAYTASYDPKDIFKTAQYVADAAKDNSLSKPAIINLSPKNSNLKFSFTPDPKSIEVSKKVDVLKSLTDRAWSADPFVTQVVQTIREITRKTTLATSSGNIINQTLGLTEFYAAAYLKDKNGNLQVGGDSRGAYAGRDFFTGENSFETVVDKSVDMAKKLLVAIDSPRGKFPVVLGPGSNGVLFHESCGHGMEADLVAKGSNFKDQIGKQTAARGVTLIDDGTIPQYPGSFAFDDEGTPSQKTVLIEDGIQKNYLCDIIWAKKLGLTSTGSGRRESFRYPPIPRMRNTYIDNGKMTPEEIIANTRKGIYVVSVGGGGQVDVVTGNFMMGVGEAYLIENGKITKPIKGATLSGMGIEALKSIDMIANDLKVFASAGRCGKGQRVPVGEGMPTIRVRSILVGGKGESWEDEKGELQ
jgi:TldD protein